MNNQKLAAIWQRAFAISTLLQQTDVEFHGFVDGFQGDPLVVAVDGGPFLGGQLHGAEAVDLIGNAAIVP